MSKQFSVTYKVAERGAEYVHSQDKGKYQAGDVQPSVAGHMWYVLSDGEVSSSYGFESKTGWVRDDGHKSLVDDVGFKETSYEVTIQLTKDQFHRLSEFSSKPDAHGFNTSIYNAFTHSCVDFAYASLEVIGFNNQGKEGNLVPRHNIESLNQLLFKHGANIIRNDLTRHKDYYDAKDARQCIWLEGAYPLQSPVEPSEGASTSNLINIDINTSPQPQQQIHGESKAQQDVANGYIQHSATHNIFALGGILSKTDFASTQMASLAAGGIRPGAMQLDPNARPNAYLSQFYEAPDSSKPDFSLRNAVTLNGLSAMTTFNTYVDPLLLDLTGQGVGMTDLQDGVLFDTDHSGTLKRTGWADRSTGILVIDDGSGQIKDVSQMFSEYYGGRQGVGGAAGEVRFKDSFAALASEDADGNGVIDQRDSIWSQLRVWVDGDHDGQSTAGELKTLAELGVTQINLRTESTDGEVRNGSKVLARGSFIINGMTREALAVDFIGDSVSSTLVNQGKGTQVTSTFDGITTTAYASHSSVGQTLDATALGVTNLYGGSGDDILVAAPTGSWLVGGGGSNTYRGSAGDDVFVISASDDVRNIHGNGGRDTAIVVGAQGVVLNMAQAGLTIAQGGAGNDLLVSGGASSAFIKGGSGDSTLIGGAGNDVLVGGSGRNTIIGGTGKAVIYAGPQGDTIHASEGGSLIYAGGGADRIYGGDGDDVIEVGNGNAQIDGGGGINLVTLHGTHGDYLITRTGDGYQVADKVAGRDGTVTLKNIQKLNFSDISAVDLQTPNAMPVADTLTHNLQGQVFDRTQPHLIAAASLLANDQVLNSQGALRIAQVGDAIGGTVSLTAQGDVLFTPDRHYSGLLSFKYGVVDAAGNASALVVDLNSGESAPMRATVTLLTPEVPLDPLAAQQWYLSDSYILPVWKDYTGKGVRIGQFEPGGQFSTAPEIFDIAHSDLASNVDRAWLQTQRDNGTLPGLVSNHATMVAGVMVAANNGSGAVGVAYDATLGGHYLANDGADLSGLGNMVNYDVANNSWGFEHDFVLSNLQQGQINTASALLLNAQYAAHNGRGGLGTVIVAAGGNSRANGGSAQGSLTNSNRYSIQVGAINAQSDLSTLQIGLAPFSNPGASLLVSAPGSNVVSTSHMLKTERGSTFGNDYTSMQGTSFAAPIVSGVVALMLQANPNLGYRDVQKILALSARGVIDPSTQWRDNGVRSWNGGGMHASDDYGFGQVDARAAVRLAESWMSRSTGENEEVLSASSGVLGKTLEAGRQLESSITMSAGVNVEHVEVDFDAQVGRLGDLSLKLISPDGTQSILLDRPGKTPQGSPGASASDAGSTHSGNFKYTFMTTHSFGERSSGKWTLQVSDVVSGLPVTINSWSLRLYGSKSSADDIYFYTDEYSNVSGKADRGVLDDALNGTVGGRNTLNAAAVSKDTSVNLLTGVASIGGTALQVRSPSTIHNILTGDGDDTLIAGPGNALLDGGRGNNLLVGGAGKDVFVVHRREAGRDVVSHFEAQRGEVINLVGFVGKQFKDLILVQQGADVRVELGNDQRIVLKNQNCNSLGAQHFQFQDTFTAPAAYVDSYASHEPIQENLGTVILNGGGNQVRLSSNAQGQMVFSLGGKVYSRDSAASDVFIVAAQPGAKNYGNALRGFRHGIDKIDLRQIGVSDYSQLSITKQQRGMINGIAQIHGVNLAINLAAATQLSINLLYLDALEVAQIGAGDFIFAEKGAVGDAVFAAVIRPQAETPVLVTPQVLPHSVVPTIEPIMVPEVTIPLSEHKTTEQILAEREQKSGESQARPPISVPEMGGAKPGLIGEEEVRYQPVKPVQVQPIVVPDAPVVEMTQPGLEPHERETPPVISWEPLQPDRWSTELDRPQTPASGEWAAANDDVIESLIIDDFGRIVTLDDKSRKIEVEAFAVTVIAGNGDNHVTVNSSMTDVVLGDGNNLIAGKADTITLGHGNNRITGEPRTIQAGDGNNQITGEFRSVKVGHGDNLIASEGYASRVTAGDGSNQITGEFAAITAGDGNNRIAGEIDNITLGHGDNLIAGKGYARAVTVGDGNNQITSEARTINVGHGNNRITHMGRSGPKITLGDGNNIVSVNGSMAQVQVGRGANDIEFNGRVGMLQFTPDVTQDRLWFQHQGQHLGISVIGSSQQVTLRNWYADTPRRPTNIEAGNGQRLFGDYVENLVQAMAAFAPPAPGSTTFDTAVQQALQPVLAANWH
ncbi:S8 family serine peptidase [Pseudomonas sp. Au-Pse12]|uniref:S8 family serine peptidase n=1 Tax=Pseudomonas sp. Au-Pse12 TaxID=2906459 RepID=UPI001E578BA0|nr:S8 family serine peptidase [Pseudomonas sp. Au-Pse12]MCE4052359.1 S8 family serine peptidase [Pseudomonas sp. Au-Pse12]